MKSTAGADEVRHDVTLSLVVERYDPAGDAERQPTNVTIYFGDTADVIGEISPAVARQFAHALASQTRWVQRWLDGVAEPITVSTVPTPGGRALQVSVAVEDNTPVVFVNYAAISAAAIRSNVRFASENASNTYLAWHAATSETFDLTLPAAEQLAANLNAYAAMADGQAPTCPTWCVTHLTDEGAVVHEGALVTVEAAGGEGMVGGSVSLRVNRYDVPAVTGQVAASIDLTQNGVDLGAASLPVQPRVVLLRVSQSVAPMRPSKSGSTERPRSTSACPPLPR